MLASIHTGPEETIYQIGTMEDSVSPEVLLKIVGEFMMELERRFGEHVHVIDWALHLDEATPHIHERHVFDYVNRYGEVEPKQEKALEALGFELPDPEKKPGRTLQFWGFSVAVPDTFEAVTFRIRKNQTGAQRSGSGLERSRDKMSER